MKKLILSLFPFIALVSCTTTPTSTLRPTVIPTMTSTPMPTATYAPTIRPTQTPIPTITPTPTRNPFFTPAPLTTLTTPIELSLPDEPSMENYKSAMRPDSDDDLLLMDKMPRYRISLRIDPDSGMLEGREQVRFINLEDVALDVLVFRLYRNYWSLVGGYDHHMQVGDVRVDSEPVEIEYIASNTGVLIPLPHPLSPGETTQIELGFSMSLEDVPQGYGELTHSYPLLAVHDESGWRTDIPTNGDLVYSESAVYAIELTIPNRMAVAASGTEISLSDNGDGTVRYSFLAPGLREFALVFGEKLQRAQTAVDGTTIYLWYFPGDPLVIAKSELLANAMHVFDRLFGPYPYADLDMVTNYDPEWWGPGGSGMEFSGLCTYTHHGANWQWSLVHEVAHQWWFGVVGNDIFLEPWLDEAMAEYSTFLYFQEAYGEEETQEAFYNNVLKDYYEIGKEYGKVSGKEPVGLSVFDFPPFDASYSWIVYGKGALFLNKLREELGHDVFLRVLQQYYRQHKYQVATGERFKETAEQVSGMDLDELFNRWVWK